MRGGEARGLANAQLLRQPSPPSSGVCCLASVRRMKYVITDISISMVINITGQTRHCVPCTPPNMPTPLGVCLCVSPLPHARLRQGHTTGENNSHCLYRLQSWTPTFLAVPHKDVG